LVSEVKNFPQSYRDHLERTWNTVPDLEKEIAQMVSYCVDVTFLVITLYMNNSYIIRVEWKMHKD
jgi:predicted ester cyclase